MSSLVLNNYSPLVDRRKKESGDKSFPIWLLVNPNYPAIRHNIWTPILEEIQDKVYRKLHTRIDTDNILIKNAVSDIGEVPNSLNYGAKEVAKEIVTLRESVLKLQPKIIITFGTITYEFVRRVFELRHEKGPKYWSTTNLGDEFERSIANFDINQTNRIPLLSRVMKSGKFIEERNYSCWRDSGNYFRDVGTKIADKIIENKDSLNIWID
ncbi:MAG TPA: hypothetical protein VIM51_00870 [Desulfosporosinus sp.]